MISIKNLTKEFSGQKVLDGIDIDIEKGEVVALVGAWNNLILVPLPLMISR